MQQFTVPQFLDVESKIIGPLTTRQFLIILAAAIIMAISYRLFDFSLFLVIAIIITIIAAVFSFVKVNSQPFHLFVLNAIQTVRRPGLRVWNNRLVAIEQEEKLDIIKPGYEPETKKEYKTSRLAELALIVDTKGRYKGE
ncbi:TPA: hypothetical protein DCZ15_02110 [Candidatus Falkowbacteria bacterium]|nr:MAG: hypothetical protein UV95_C0001G0183 [Candidatus Falkowbacteria bacterium GW2011_GWF2_43_32]HBA36649.1 hypothetical protein [Candidatus Falkowbacteria bacterium]